MKLIICTHNSHSQCHSQMNHNQYKHQKYHSQSPTYHHSLKDKHASIPAPQLPSVSTQTCIISGDVVTLDEHLKIKQELEELKKQHYELLVQCAKKDAIQAEVQLKHPVFDEESLKNNDEKVRFFTGLTNWDTLNTLYLFVLPYHTVIIDPGIYSRHLPSPSLHIPGPQQEQFTIPSGEAPT